MTDLSPRAMADVVVDAAGDKKAEDILVLNVSELTTIADLFIICTGRGERQVQAIADAVREKAIEAGRRPLGGGGDRLGRCVRMELGGGGGDGVVADGGQPELLHARRVAA